MIKIVVDSGCDLPKDMLDNNNLQLEVVPLNLTLGDTNYVDSQDLDIEQYVSAMMNTTSMPKTAAPSPELYLEAYKGDKDVFAITISSQLSGSYNSAVLAKTMYLEEIGNKFIYVVDSLSASVGEMLIALKLHELSKKNFSNNEIVEHITSFVSDMRTYFVLERYENLVKTGRITPYVAKLASFLNIKPICDAVDGKTRLIGQARGEKKMFSKLIDLMLKDNKDFENRILGIAHVCCYERALAFKEEVLKRMHFKDIFIVQASGLCSTYADSGGIIIAF